MVGDSEEIEFQMEFPWATITEDPEPLFEQFANHYGVSVDVIKAHPQNIIGSADVRAVCYLIGARANFILLMK